MSTNYKDHPIRGALQQILAFNENEALGVQQPALTEEQRWQLDRVFEFARVVENSLDQTPSTLVSLNNLNALHGTINTVFNEVNSFIANKNIGHISNASTHIDQAGIPQMNAAFGAKPRAQAKLGEIVDDLRMRSGAAIAAVEKDKVALQEKVATLTTAVNEQATRIGELTLAVEAQKKEAVGVTAEVKGEYAKTDKDIRTAFDVNIRNLVGEFGKFQEDTTSKANNHISVLAKKEQEARDIVKIVGNIGITGNYQKIANDESSAANFWRWATVGFFGVGVVVALTAFIAHFYNGATSENFWTFAMRFITAIAIASPAFYTARESARHRTNADRARQRELELASLGPFIELLPDDEKHAITKLMTEKYFGKEVEAHHVQQPVNPKDAIDLAKTAIEGLVKAAK
jgi:hypothetical protein